MRATSPRGRRRSALRRPRPGPSAPRATVPRAAPGTGVAARMAADLVAGGVARRSAGPARSPSRPTAADLDRCGGRASATPVLPAGVRRQVLLDAGDTSWSSIRRFTGEVTITPTAMPGT